LNQAPMTAMSKILMMPLSVKKLTVETVAMRVLQLGMAVA
jgi:hypothetical protein